MNGKLHLPAYAGKHYTITGGPYRECPTGYIGVKLAAEIQNAHYHHKLDIPDFSVPVREDLYEALGKVLLAMMKGRKVYVGCMAGRGRTGLFLSALVKLWGIEHPIKFVRRYYYEHAVETEGQASYIRGLTFPFWLRALAQTAKVRGWVPGQQQISKGA